MEINLIEEIHKQYDHYMEDFELVGSYSVFIPFFKVTMKMQYLYESELSLIEEFICRCIQRGVKTKEKITDVLAFETEFFNYAVQPLVDNNYLTQQIDEKGNEVFEFTELGKELVLKKTKYEPRLADIEWFFDGLNSEYKLEFFAKEQEHQFRKYDEISQNPDNLIIFPKAFPNYEKQRDYQCLSRKVLAMIEDSQIIEGHEVIARKIINIENFELLRDREVFYHEYRVLVYKNPKQGFRLLAHDPCGLNFVDQRVTESIITLFEEGKFAELLNTEDTERQSIADILHALQNYAQNEVDNLSPEIVESTVAKIEELKEQKIASSYIMNYRIRELFLEYLKNAQESLYIISPWMNNHIINSQFKADLLNLLKRGVKVRIICGIANKSNMNQDKRDQNTYKIAQELLKMAKPYGDLFKLKYGQTHEKLLICDNKHYINGSFNFLSYAGEDDNFFRNEGSTYLEDENLINETIKLRFNF